MWKKHANLFKYRVNVNLFCYLLNFLPYAWKKKFHSNCTFDLILVNIVLHCTRIKSILTTNWVVVKADSPPYVFWTHFNAIKNGEKKRMKRAFHRYTGLHANRPSNTIYIQNTWRVKENLKSFTNALRKPLQQSQFSEENETFDKKYFLYFAN